MSKKKPTGSLLKTTALTAALIAGTYILASFGNGSPIPVLSHHVLKMTDGDSFITTEKEGVRLALLNAPERGMCGYESSKKALEKLIINRPIFVRAYFNDSFGRLVSLVYTNDGLINEKLVRNGHAYYYQREPIPPEIKKIMKDASSEARKHKRGIHSSICTQVENLEKPDCNIKGNASSARNLYLTPNCQAYKQTVVQLYLGDKWFCSEKEALAAGFKKADQCD